MAKSHALHDWCPICETPKLSEGDLADHMKSEHHRLIRCTDIQRQDDAIALRNRLATIAFEEVSDVPTYL